MLQVLLKKMIFRKERKAINIFFQGFHKGDTLLMKSIIAGEMIMQTAYSDKEDNNKIRKDSAEGL